MSRILGAKWWTPRLPLSPLRKAAMGGEQMRIGIVAFESGPDGEWGCYIGYGDGSDEHLDSESVLASGVPFGNVRAACDLFPRLDGGKFRG